MAFKFGMPHWVLEDKVCSPIKDGSSSEDLPIRRVVYPTRKGLTRLSDHPFARNR